jgi:hypothetical protein
MSFYPADTDTYTAVSMPVGETDENGLYSLDADGNIAWDKTVIYHIYTDDDGNSTLRRTVFDPRDNTLDQTQRYAQLESTVTSGEGGAGSVTDTDFLENLENFEIQPLSAFIDFYEDSDTPVRHGKVVFGVVPLDAGDHTIRFEMAGKNDSSSGYAIGIDSIMIEPSGSKREVEYYNSSFAPVGSLVVSGGSVNRVYEPLWDNSNYLEFDATAIEDYIEITDYYDLCRESGFENASKSNARSYGEEVRILLDVPEEEQPQNVKWYASEQTGDSVQAGNDGYVNPDDPTSVPAEAVVVRTLISNPYLSIDPDVADNQVDLIRVKFKSSSSGVLRIERAYITRKDKNGSNSYDGLINEDPSGKTIEEYHMHQQLFFTDTADDFDGDGDTGNIVTGAIIPADSEAWSEWTAFPVIAEDSDGDSVDYFISFCILDTSEAACKYWSGATEDNSYGIQGAYSTFSNAEGVPDWTGSSFSAVIDPDPSSDYIFAVSEIDTWRKTGSVESEIYDTEIDNPAYNQVKWSESSPSGTEVLMKVRSSDDEDMTGASAWSSISGSTANPGDVSSVGTGRYFQFLAELSTEPYWDASGSTMTYSEYIDSQLTGNVYDFPEDSGEPYITGVYSTWVDDVETDWPGNSRICSISGYIAKKNNYGQAQITVDGVELVRSLDVKIGTSVDFEEQQITEEFTIGTDPRNTGK